MPPIRTFIFAAFVAAIGYFTMLSFIGSFTVDNHAQLPPQLQKFYSQLNLAGTNTSISILTTQANSAQANLANGNIVSGVGSSIGLVASFFGSLPTLLGGMVNFSAFELAAAGIPVAYAQAAAYAMIIMFIALGLISAIFIFGV
ncbi:MAG: hypothetical protein QXI95_02755 [Candidatus Micrarchaeaceae archaeon]